MLFALLCVFVMASCQTEKADYFNYTEANLGVMGKLVKLMHGWIGNYGWTVVVFTLFLKLVTLPLDIWQRVASRKMTQKNKQMQPLLAEIDKRYGANTPRANEEKKKVSLSIRALLSPDAEDGESQDVAEAADEEADVTEAGN